jgi:uncharacterized protein YjbJ (UPF0337 family)
LPEWRAAVVRFRLRGSGQTGDVAGSECRQPTSSNDGRTEQTMANPTELKGRAKQAAGDLTDDNDLKREGGVDRATGNTQENIDEAADSAKGKLEEAADKVKEMFHRDDKD